MCSINSDIDSAFIPVGGGGLIGGVGSALTSLLSMYHPKELNALLGIPTAEGWSCAATVSFGYPTGRWGVAPRRPAHEVSGRNGWNGDVGFEVGEPLFEV